MATNTFTGMHLEFRNKSIHALLAKCMTFRKQLTKRAQTDFAMLSGWNNAMAKYMTDELEHVANLLESITYNETDATQEELEEQAADTSRSLADDFDARSINSDNIVQSVGRVADQVVWDLSGNDPDIPQPSTDTIKNDFARAFIKGLDSFMCEATRLDSRHEERMITKYESVQLRNRLNELYTLNQRFGGEDNRSDIPSGTLNVDEPTTFGT